LSNAACWEVELIMKRTIYFISLILLVAGAFLAGSRYNQRSAAHTGATTARKILYYVDPMHPAYKSDKAGIAPDCGMELVPVYEGEAAPGPASNIAGTPEIGLATQQAMGVRVAEVSRESPSSKLRLFGRVVPDESRVYKLNAGIDGYIQEVSSATTGSQVKKDQVLATFSAPNVTMTVQTFILNIGAEERFKKSADDGSPEGQSLPAANANVQQRIQQLQAVGMSLRQIEEIRHTHQVPETIKIISPVDGFVTARNVSPGQKFDKGADWFVVADLKHVWILADLLENDAQYIRPGQRAEIHLPGRNQPLAAEVKDVLPQVDAATRTLKVRIEMDNPAFILRPDMFVNVEVPISLPPGLSVPVDAVLDSGLVKRVFVDHGNGAFEPRQVETGWRSDGRVQIVRGLKAGERIVVSGTFLVDSESRLRAAARP
jgi:membrane fusion protein, copper/silver efflux system